MASRALSKTTNGITLIFDGDCAFCTTWVNRLEATLPRFPRAVPWQWIDLDTYALSHDDVNRYVWLVTPERQLAGHLAVSGLLRMQPSVLLRFAGHLIATAPLSWIASAAYTAVARNRHRLPGGTPACAMKPTA